MTTRPRLRTPLTAEQTDIITNRLHTAVLGDVLDQMGHRAQFLDPAIRPLDPTRRLVGRAMTVLEEDTGDVETNFGLMFEALDQIGPGEIYLAAGGSPTYAMWGELMSRTAKARGGVGTVLAGYMRDTPQVREMGYPVFSLGSYAQDQRGRGHVTDYRCPLTIGSVTVHDGDVVVGDEDGVLIIPADALDDCLERSVTKLGIEDEIGERLAAGADSKAMFEEYGVM